MKPHSANLINGLILLAVGLWGYFASSQGSPTALIAPSFGLLFILLTPLMKKENKVVAHVVVLLTFLLLLSLVMPLMRQSDTIAQVRVIIMMLSCLFAFIIYIKSFIDARKAKSAE